MKKKTILVTVGTQLPFERIFEYVDMWQKKTATPNRIYAQTGKTSIPYNFSRTKSYLSNQEFLFWLQEADCIIAHAGMGTIIEAYLHNKNIIIVPRESIRGEHRDDHQLETVKEFSYMPNVKVATTQEEFSNAIKEALDDKSVTAGYSQMEMIVHESLGKKVDQWITSNIESPNYKHRL